jgi:hypothetical protein
LGRGAQKKRTNLNREREVSSSGRFSFGIRGGEGKGGRSGRRGCTWSWVVEPAQARKQWKQQRPPTERRTKEVKTMTTALGGG